MKFKTYVIRLKKYCSFVENVENFVLFTEQVPENSEPANIFWLRERWFRLVDSNGYAYLTSSSYKNNMRNYWRCPMYRKQGYNCKATAVTEGRWILRKNQIHTHPPGGLESTTSETGWQQIC